MIRWRTSGWTLFPIIAIVLAIYLLTPSCAESRTLLLVYEDCNHKTDYVEVEFMVSTTPTIECVRMAPEYKVNPLWIAIQIPYACGLRLGNKGLMILPPASTVEMVIHEFRHLMGEEHLPFTFGPMYCPRD